MVAGEQDPFAEALIAGSNTSRGRTRDDKVRVPTEMVGGARTPFRARKGGPEAVASRQRARLAEMVAFARHNSPYYREVYRGLPARVEDPTVLPVTNKKKPMARLDDWPTDRGAPTENARTFVEEPYLLRAHGARYADYGSRVGRFVPGVERLSARRVR